MLAPGTYTLSDDLTPRAFPIELVGHGGPVSIAVPGGALPAGLTAGTDVTVTTP